VPVTLVFIFLFFFGIILTALLIPTSIVLFVLTKKKKALLVLLLPVCLLIFSVCMPLFIFGCIWIHDVALNMQPTRTFNATFGFKPDKQTEILETYVKNGLDYKTTLIKFRTTEGTIDKIVQNRFEPVSSETFQEKYRSNRHNLPNHVQGWFTPDYDKPNLCYLAEPFDNSFSNVNAAILCYNEQTQIAYFHWIGLD
jgi:hypothetical protein